MQDSPIICDVDVITFIESAKSNPFFHVLPIGLALFSINGRFIYCNRAYLDMFELLEDVAGRHVSDYFLTGYRGVMECLRAREIFLDEIGELPLPVQAKLLRVLESGEIQKIAHRGALRSDFRLLCATNRDLRAMVMQHLFREDLYHRLSVFELVVPPLRERIHDLPMLVHHCISQCVGKERARGIYLDDEVLRAFQQNFWRGNVRELKNVLTYGVYALEEGENILTMRHLPVRFVREVQGSGAAGEAVQGGAGGVSGMLAEAGAHAERKILQDTLETFQYNKVKTAKALGISRSKLYRKLRERGLFSGREKEPRENAQ